MREFTVQVPDVTAQNIRLAQSLRILSFPLWIRWGATLAIGLAVIFPALIGLGLGLFLQGVIASGFPSAGGPGLMIIPFLLALFGLYMGAKLCERLNAWFSSFNRMPPHRSSGEWSYAFTDESFVLTTHAARTEIAWENVDAVVDCNDHFVIIAALIGYSVLLPAETEIAERDAILAFVRSRLSREARALSDRLQKSA